MLTMVTTAYSVKLRRHRRIAWYVIFALFVSGIALGKLGFQDAAAIVVLGVISSPLYLLYVGSRIRRAESEQAKLTAKEDIKLQPYWKILVGNLLFAGFVLLMCSFSIFMVFFSALIVIGVLLPMAVSASKNPPGLRLQRWTRFLIYAFAVSVGGMLDHQASEQEKRNFGNIITAVEQYKAVEKHYPDSLEQLVPKYLPAVPLGRWGKFMYDANNFDDAHLFHMAMPPVKETYDFKLKTSKTWD